MGGIRTHDTLHSTCGQVLEIPAGWVESKLCQCGQVGTLPTKPPRPPLGLKQIPVLAVQRVLIYRYVLVQVCCSGQGDGGDQLCVEVGKRSSQPPPACQ